VRWATGNMVAGVGIGGDVRGRHHEGAKWPLPE
jgi:hypothetical protein